MRLLAVSFLVAACGAAQAPQALPAADDLTVAATIGPQSFTHGTLTSKTNQLAYAFTGTAGDTIAPDVWPTAASALQPTLVLLGPKGANGHRSAIATGSPRGNDDRHLAIDGFVLPKTGSYLAVVGTAAGSKGGQFTVRLWMQSSHLPRQEGSQVDLTLQTSPAAQATIQSHVDQAHPWSDAEVDGIISGIQSQSDLRVAVSDTHSLLWALASTGGTADQEARAHDAGLAVVGTQADFAALDPQLQSFALWWLEPELLAGATAASAPASISDTVSQLVAAWPGAAEDLSARQVRVKTLGGTVYGYQVDWSASQFDIDGTQVWYDTAREWFDAQGNWLAEQSAGASEPDDD